MSAKAGIDVVLLDTTQENADRGRPTRKACWTRPWRAARPRREKRDALLARIQPTTAYETCRAATTEAVFEDRAIKADCAKSWPRR